MAPLPLDRVEPGGAFEVSGVDCFGPFVVKHGARSTAKRWVVIFTCYKSRAVHFEVVEAMSTTAFLNALIRFSARRPGIKKLSSDCGSNFIGAAKVIEKAVEAWNQSVTAGERLRTLIWEFNPPLAHHRGGLWERLIKSTRKHLASLLGKETLENEVLVTTLAQVEYIMNFRPVTHLSDDPKDVEALSPAHLLYPGVNFSNKNEILPPAPPGGDNLRFSFQRARALVDAFWIRWVRDYLSSLKDRQKWTKDRANPKVGQLVLLLDELKVRNDWKLGRILAVYGDENNVRTVDVWTGKTNGKTYRRDMKKIVALELDEF